MSTVAFEDFDGGAINRTLTQNVFDYGAGGGTAGDVFGRVDGQAGGTGMPFDVADDSVVDVSGARAGSNFPTDSFGLAGQNTTAFFALNDADAVGVNNAVWTFDISSASSISDIEIDIAALGDFEASSTDGFEIEARVDSNAYQTIFFARTDESAFKTYRTLDGGSVFADDDPLELFIDGAGTSVGFLDKSDPITGDFDTYQSTLLAGQSGSTLDIRLSWAGTPSGSEPMGIDNITINGTLNALPSLTLSATPGTFAEDETSTITVTRSGDTTNPLTVDLSSDDTGEATVPASVTIAAGQLNATFLATGVLDSTADGDQSVGLTATASGFNTGTTSLTVTDIDGVSAATVAINEVHADPEATILGDANGDGTRDASEDEFVEIVNVSGASLDLSGYTLSDGVQVRHTFASGTVLADQQAIVVFGGGTPTGDFGGAIAQTASTGSLGLNNGGDTVTLNDGSTDIATFTYGGEGGNNQSLTLDPDLTGTATQHASATGSGGSLFSPGTEIDGTPFAGNNNSLTPLTPIYDIQGTGHTSPLNGQTVTTSGIVTAVDSNGFYLQDATGDADIATSDALFVFTSSTPTVAVGDEVQVAGTVSEFTPGGASTGNLSTTQVGSVTAVTVLSSGNSLPAATITGASGRVPPDQNIDDDAFASFDPTTDGIDFFESLEGMLVTGENLVAVSGTNRFGEIFAVANNGDDATGISTRGTLNISPDDFNPEKIQIDADFNVSGFDLPEVNAGDSLGDVTGVIGYSFGNFEIIPTVDFTSNVTSGSLTAETTTLEGTADKVTIASYNVLNLETNDSDGDTDVANGRFEAIASQIINNLGSPDIIGLQEIQDNSGSVDDGTVSATATLQALVDAIAVAGGETYQFIDNTFIANNSSGGQPGGNIRTAFLYNPSRVTLDPSSVQTIGGQGSGESFEGARLPLVATFNFNGEDVTVVNNHFSSKGGSAPILGVEQDFAARQEEVTVNGSLDERQTQAAAVKSFVEPLINNGDNVVVLGDFNEFEFVFPVTTLEDAGLSNLTNTLPEDERYSFIFQGNSQSLDHILVNDNLAANAEFDIVHVNSEFAETNTRASDHDPLITRLELGSSATNFKLQILHASDLEGGVEAIQNAPNFAAVVDALEQDTANFDGSVLISAGDNYIPGPFFNAAGDRGLRDELQAAYQTLFGEAGLTNIREDAGRVDITIMNILGFDASAIGNHEFDAGTNTFGGLLETDIRGSGLGDVRWLGTQFPYLSANLDFSADSNLSSLFTNEILPSTDFQSLPSDLNVAAAAPKIAPATVINEGGERIGVVGATTQVLASITSSGDVSSIAGTSNNMVALAAALQPVINDVIDGDDDILGTADDVNKIILTSHLQQIVLEKELAGLLNGVDVIIAGGSDTLQADSNDVLRSGDTADEGYPFLTKNADGDDVAIVSTDGEYSYVGRLVVEFDADGKLVVDGLDETINGAYATDDAGVLAVTGEVDVAAAIANSTKATEVKNLTDAVETIVNAADGNILGRTGVFLEGRRSAVRTQTTNLGNLTADANLAAAQAFDPTVVVSIKNGGGIRAQIGQVDGDTGELLTTQANANADKEVGDISQLDVENALRFNNGLTLLDVTLLELKQLLEHGVAATEAGATPGQFPQVGGLRFSFDPSKTAIEFEDLGNNEVNVVTEGERIQNLALVDELGNVTKVVVKDGEFVADPNETIRLVTLDFLDGIFSDPDSGLGGDGYPFPAFGENAVQLKDVLTDSGSATFADPGTEQDAFAEFLVNNFSSTPFFTQDTAADQDLRIQNLQVTEGLDTVLNDVASEELSFTELSTITPGDGLLGAEISAFDPRSDRLFVTSDDGLQVINFRDPSHPSFVTVIEPTKNGANSNNVTSVAVGSGISRGIVAIAVANDNVTENGSIFFYRTRGRARFLGSVEVGALPDMLTFSPDGTKLLVANEGQSAGDENEPDILPNPEGSVSIITVNRFNISASQVQTVAFTGLNSEAETLRDKGVRINENTPSVAADLEPEYIAIEGSTAYITLQENNAVAVIQDINNPTDFTVDDVLPLGLKDHTLPFNKLDPSNRDGSINLQNLPVFGMYMPDAIDTYTAGGTTYFVTANEGDGRDVDETRIKDLNGIDGPNLDPDAFPDADVLREDEVLGRLKASNVDGDTDGDGDIDQLQVFGGRSFSIFDEAGNLVFDSADLIARVTAAATPTLFNANDGDPGEFDDRSDDKGAEPEGIVVVTLGLNTYAFVGLERSGGGFMAFNISNPEDVQFVDYIRTEGNIAPEGLTFISAEDSPTGVDLLVVQNEESNTITTYQLGANFGFDPEAQNDKGIFKILDESNLDVRLQVSVETDKTKTSTFNELVLFEVDDEAGTVDGLSKRDKGYLDAILNSDGVFSVLSLLETKNNPAGLPQDFDQASLSTLLPTLAADTRFGFMLIEDGTLDELQAGIHRKVFFSNRRGFKTRDFTNLNFDLNFRGRGNKIRFEVEAVNADSVLPDLEQVGSGLQTEIEVLDLRGKDDLTGQVTVFSEAGFNNTVGFYRTDVNGNILSEAGDILASIGDADYTNIMLEQSQTLGIEIDRNTATSFAFEGGGILAPFIIANGDFGNFDVAEVYTPFLGANADGTDHFQMLGDNVFGIEDLSGGGDRDFDDMIVKIEFA